MVSRRKLLKLAFWLSPVFLLLGFLLFLVEEHIRGDVALRRYKGELAKAGLTLNPLQFAKPTPGENGMPALLSAAGALKKGPVLPGHYPTRMRATNGDFAIVSFRQPGWTEDKTEFTWEALAADLETNRAALSQIRTALKAPVLNANLNYSLGPNIPLTGLSTLKSATYWLGSSVQLALRRGDDAAARENLLALLELPRALESDRILISELVRIAIASIGYRDLWEALQNDRWTDADLAGFQRAVERQSFLDRLTVSMEGEMLFADVTYGALRGSNEMAADFLFTSQGMAGDAPNPGPVRRFLQDMPFGDEIREFLFKQVYCRIWRYAWLDQDELRYCKEARSFRDLLREAEREKSLAALKVKIDQLLEASEPKGLYDRLRYPYMMSVDSMTRSASRAMQVETERSLCLAAIGLRRYQLRHGQLPNSLQRLVPEFLSAVPLDTMDGHPLRYRLNSDGTFQLYSTGEDLKDDGGDSGETGDTKLPTHYWRRRDAVWPRPFPAPATMGRAQPTPKDLGAVH